MLIKFSDNEKAVEIRSLSASAMKTPSPVQTKVQVDPKDQVIENLRSEIDHLTSERDELAGRFEVELRDAVVKAEERGAARSSEATSEIVELLERALKRAEDLHREQFSRLEAFALEIARTALSALIADPDKNGELVEGIILRQVNDLSSQTKISIAVSAEDFDCAEALAELKSRVSGAELIIEDQLASGEAVIKPRLGQIDISAPDQFEAVLSVLNRKARRN